MERRRSKSHFLAPLFTLAGIALAPCSAWAAGAGCDAGKWPLSAVQTHFGGTLPALGNGATLPALGAPALVNLTAQSEVVFPHAPGRASKPDPAYAPATKPRTP